MRLCINIDHVATVRNARGGTYPDPVAAALLCEKAGASGIVCHLREDRRHIKDDDVVRLRRNVTTKLDLEMAATAEIIAIAKIVKPELVTLVPEKRKELTTEGGLDVVRYSKSLKKAVTQLHDSGIDVSMFVDPVEEQIEESKEIGADFIEIHTGEYSEARAVKDHWRELKRIRQAAKFARSLGLGVNAGHGLDHKNIKPVARIKEIEEVSIGHALIAYSLFTGLEQAVKEMLELMKARK